MSITIAEADVKVTARGDGVGRQIIDDVEGAQGQASSAGGGLGRSIFGGVVAGFAAVGGAQAIGSFFSGAVTGASDLAETVSKSEAIFGSNISTIREWASTSATTVGLSQQAALAAASSFGDMFTQIGFTGDAAAAMSTEVVQASADLASFSNLETADVADRISAAFRGEYDSLQAVIPNINAARVESEALAMTGKDTASALTAQERAAAVLAIVQQDGARAMGDFSRTSDGAANAARIATARFEDQQAALGQQLLPAWTGFLGFINDVAIPGFTSVVSWIGENRGMLIGLGTALAAGAVAWGVITAAIGAYRIVQTIATAVTAAGSVAQWALNAAMSANPIGLVVVAIAALVAGLVWVATQTTFFQDAWQWMVDAVGTAWQWLLDSVINPVGNAIGAAFTWVRVNAIDPLVTGWNVAMRAIGVVMNWLSVNVVRPVTQAVAAAFRWVWQSVIMPVANFIRGAIDNVGSTIRSVFGGIGTFIGNAFQSALSAVRGPINGIIGLVNSAIRGINSLSVTIPSWVPLVGGQTWGVNIPTIPMLARGTNFAPDAFIAGERGPELITGARGATVTPYSETRDTMRRQRERGGREVYAPITIETNDPVLAGREAARQIVARIA